MNSFLAFTQEHIHCQGQREYGSTNRGTRWAACPCGAYLEARLESFTLPWPPRTFADFILVCCFYAGRWYERQVPLRPAILRVLVVTWRTIDVAVAVLYVFAVLFEHAAVTLFPFHKLLDKFGGRPRKHSK